MIRLIIKWIEEIFFESMELLHNIYCLFYRMQSQNKHAGESENQVINFSWPKNKI
jgi:hypothetical protein